MFTARTRFCSGNETLTIDLRMWFWAVFWLSSYDFIFNVGRIFTPIVCHGYSQLPHSPSFMNLYLLLDRLLTHASLQSSGLKYIKAQPLSTSSNDPDIQLLKPKIEYRRKVTFVQSLLPSSLIFLEWSKHSRIGRSLDLRVAEESSALRKKIRTRLIVY
jgi:hypothetical protein